jgi:inosine/xanthosine triphosphate pyrophosphatase family protein
MLDRIALITGNAGKAAEYAAMLGIDPRHRTYAQMTSEEKNKISHRRRAVDEMRSAFGLT